MNTSDFDQRYLELWRDAAAKRVVIPASDMKDAFAFRHRLYRCRLAMKADKHEWYELAKSVTVSVEMIRADGTVVAVSGKEKTFPANCSFQLSMQNPDARFAEALEKAGYGEVKAPSLD